MAHVHDDDANSYYLDQLCTIAICGALGGVSIMLWQRDLLRYILAPTFHLPVLLTGITLVVLVGIRTAFLWKELGQPAHGHTHDHGHCDHDHDHCGHDHHHDHGHGHHHHDHDHDCGDHHDHHHQHVTAAPPAPAPHTHDHHGHDHNHDDHGHDHGFSPWRYAVLMLPVVLYFLDLPNASFSSGYFEQSMAPVELADSGRINTVAGGVALMPAALTLATPLPSGVGLLPASTDAVTAAVSRAMAVPVDLDFKELPRAAYREDRRSELQGVFGRLRGQFIPNSPDNTFKLARMKMTCCAADAIALSVIVVAPESLGTAFAPGKWVEVTGQIQFRKSKTRDEYFPVLQVDSLKDIRPIEPEANPYLQ